MQECSVLADSFQTKKEKDKQRAERGGPKWIILGNVEFQQFQCYCDNAATTLDQNCDYTTISLISRHQIAAAIMDDDIREHCVMGGW